MKKLPKTDDQWSFEAKKLVGNASLHSDNDIVFNSASKIQAQQYLLLRVLQGKPYEAHDLQEKCERVGDLIEKIHLDHAKAFLERLPSWAKYLEALDSATRHVDPDQGTFALFSHYQQRCSTALKTPILEGSFHKVQFSPPSSRTRQAVLIKSDTGGQPATPTPAERRVNPINPPVKNMTKQMESLDLDFESDLTSDDGTPSPSAPLSPWSPVTGVSAEHHPAAEDELIVNTALILFLNAITIHCKPLQTEWTLYRQPFVMRDRHNHKVYEARVDGVLRNVESKVPGILVEVKPFLRNASSEMGKAIRMQEAAQMAAWICPCPPPPPPPPSPDVGNQPNSRRDALPSTLSSTRPNTRPNTRATAQSRSRLKSGKSDAVQYRRLLVSQDRQEIYVNVGTFDYDYVRYVRDEIEKTDSFLQIEEYGPFDVT